MFQVLELSIIDIYLIWENVSNYVLFCVVWW